jgi:hypothetical protein
MEVRREDDAATIRDLKERLTEAEGFVSLRPKLQGELSPITNCIQHLLCHVQLN